MLKLNRPIYLFGCIVNPKRRLLCKGNCKEFPRHNDQRISPMRALVQKNISIHDSSPELKAHRLKGSLDSKT